MSLAPGPLFEPAPAPRADPCLAALAAERRRVGEVRWLAMLGGYTTSPMGSCADCGAMLPEVPGVHLCRVEPAATRPRARR